MKYVCDAPPYTWFRLETESEAAQESNLMQHAVQTHFVRARDRAIKDYAPPKALSVIEQNIGLKDHIQRAMPLFVTLRDREGKAHVTGMLPPKGLSERVFKPIIVGHNNSDPYPTYGPAIRHLAAHLGMTLDHERCYPYIRG